MIRKAEKSVAKGHEKEKHNKSLEQSAEDLMVIWSSVRLNRMKGF